MTIMEALNFVRGKNMWIRPVSWRGVGSALTIQNGKLFLVPSARGGFPWNPDVEDICGEWELVEPYEVCKER